MIQLYDTLLRRLGVTEYRLELNSIGDRECRPAYLERLRAWLDEHDDRARRRRRASRRRRSPLRALRQHRREAAASRRCSARRRRSATRSATPAASTSRRCAATSTPTASRYELVPTLVRGLDYYTRTTWEFVGPEDGSQSTISRRRPLRRPGRGARRPADAGRRLRRRDRAAPARARGRAASGRGAGDRRLLRRRGRRAARAALLALVAELRAAGSRRTPTTPAARSRASSPRRGRLGAETVVIVRDGVDGPQRRQDDVSSPRWSQLVA